MFHALPGNTSSSDLMKFLNGSDLELALDRACQCLYKAWITSTCHIRNTLQGGVE